MFTLKFFRYFPDGTEKHEVTCSDDYDITVTKDLKAVEAGGYVRHIKPHNRQSFTESEIDDGFDICFIENHSGKTIDRITV